MEANRHLLKLEPAVMSVQVFSFKCRGAFNKMKNLSEDQRQRGVVCSSAGNHAQGVALAASRLVILCPSMILLDFLEIIV